MTARTAILALSRYSIAVWRRNVTVWRRLMWPSLTTNVLDPLIFLFAFGYGLGAVVQQIGGLVGTDGAEAIEAMLVSLNRPGAGTLTAIVGAITLFIGATTVFAELQDALDRIWRVPERKKASGIVELIRTRVLSFGMVLGIGFLLIVSLVASAAVSALGRAWTTDGEVEAVAHGIDLLLSFGLTTVVFAMIYKIMPHARVRWLDVWLGALVTATLFTIGKVLIGLYIGKTGVASGYGAAGSLVIVLVWVYYSAQIFLLGAEFTWLYANRYGSLKAAPQSGTTAHPQTSAATGAASTRRT